MDIQEHLYEFTYTHRKRDRYEQTYQQIVNITIHRYEQNYRGY